MPCQEFLQLVDIDAARALIRRLDSPPLPGGFGERLLEVTQIFNIETIMIGAIPIDLGSKRACCVIVDRAPLPPPPGKWAALRAALAVPSRAETHVFLRDGDSRPRAYSIEGREHAGIEWKPGTGLVCPAVVTDLDLHGIAFFGAELSLDAASRSMLSFLGHYSLGRVLRNNSGAPSLSSRQLETLQWAAEGKTDSEIATILGISDHTVDKYMRQAREALHAVNRTALIVRAIRLGLIA